MPNIIINSQKRNKQNSTVLLLCFVSLLNDIFPVGCGVYRFHTYMDCMDIFYITFQF